MRHLLLLAFTISMFGALPEASAGKPVDTGQNFYGYWRWRPVDFVYDSNGNVISTIDTDWFFNPRDACKAELQRLRDNNGIDATYKGIKRADSYDVDRDYDCLFTHDDGTPDSSSGVTSEYACPSNAHMITLNNSGMAVDRRCVCDSGPCVSPSPPSVDTTNRCKPPGTLSTIDDVIYTSTQNQFMAKLAIGNLYAEYMNELKATEDCTFQPSDYYPNAPSTVNIGFLCGYRNGDEAAANKQAGLSSTPSGYVWHHNLALGKMELVTQTAHNACGSHIGGVAVWKEAFGLQDYPLALPPLY